MEITYLVASFALGGGFCYGLWYIYTRKDITVSVRQGMNPEGLRYGTRAPGFGNAKKEIDRKLAIVENRRRRQEGDDDPHRRLRREGNITNSDAYCRGLWQRGTN